VFDFKIDEYQHFSSAIFHLKGLLNFKKLNPNQINGVPEVILAEDEKNRLIIYKDNPNSQNRKSLPKWLRA
jgi:hypothetical protein